MKTILLLMCSLFLISQTSFGKEINTNVSAGNRDINLERITFNNSNVSKKTLIERHRIWLNFSNAEGAFKQQLLGYVTGATNGWDKLYDAVSIDSNPYVDFYSINGGKNLTIQGRGVPFLITDEVPLGYKTNIVGTFNITIDHVDGLFVNQDIFLKDLVTGVTHNLKNGTYSFTTLVGRFNDRFVLLYINTPPVTPAPALVPLVAENTNPIVNVPVVPTPVVTVPVVTVPVVAVPVVPTPVVTVPVVTVPVVPTPIVTVPVVTVPVVPAPVVAVPAVTVPVVPTPVATQPLVTVPVVPPPVVIVPVVTVPVVPAPVLTEPVVTVPVVPAPAVTQPVVTVPVVLAPVVIVPVVTVPVVLAPVVIVPVVTVPVVLAPVVTEPVATVPEILVAFVANNDINANGKGKPVIVSVDNNQITITSTGGDINEIYVYTMGQKQLFQRKNINTNEYVIASLDVATQVLLIKTQLKNGKWTNSKVVL